MRACRLARLDEVAVQVVSLAERHERLPVEVAQLQLFARGERVVFGDERVHARLHHQHGVEFLEVLRSRSHEADVGFARAHHVDGCFRGHLLHRQHDVGMLFPKCVDGSIRHGERRAVRHGHRKRPAQRRGADAADVAALQLFESFHNRSGIVEQRAPGIRQLQMVVAIRQ